MAWLSALIKAILEWVTGEVKKDTKGVDADPVPEDLKNRWRERVNEQLKKEEKQKEEKQEDEGRLTDIQKKSLDGED